MDPSKKTPDARIPDQRFLYKYKSPTPITHLRDLIVESRFWFSKPSDFNDPFDMKVNVFIDGNKVDKIRRLKRAMVRTGSLPKGLDPDVESARLLARINSDQELFKIANRSHETTKESCGVICFSEYPRNILMWSHYGAFHKGVCFQFMTTKDPRVFVRTLPVNYKIDYPKYNWVKDQDKKLVDAVFTKFEDWSYEKEWRIMYPDSAHQYQNFSPSSLTGLIYGCNVEKETIKGIRGLLTERATKLLPSIREYKAVQSNTLYKLKIIRLN